MSKLSDIDLGNLEKDFVEQVAMMERYALTLMPRAKKKLAEVSAEQKVQEAELSRHIRQNPKKYGIDKITEAAIKEALVLHPKHRKIIRKGIKAQYMVDRFSGAIKTLDDRRRAIEGEITLHGQGYFAKPSLKGANGDFETNSRLKDRKNRHKKKK